MAFKLLVVLAIFNVVLSDPLPDPDPNIEINILQKVETSCCPGDCCGGKCGGPCVDLESGKEGKCYVSGKEPHGWSKRKSYDCNDVPNCCCYAEGCEFDGKNYPNNAVYTGACVDLVCNKGVWEIQGGSKDSCGFCGLAGDPEITPYDNHTSIPGYPTSWGPAYRVSALTDKGTFVLSQPGGSPVPSDLSVYGEFGPCVDGADHNNTAQCVYTVHYKQGSLEVEVILPKAMYEDIYTYCQYEKPDDPKCLTKVRAKKGDGSYFAVDDKITTLSGSSGTVLIFISDSCNGESCYVTVVGSNGFTVAFGVESENWAYYYVSIYPMPYLHNQLYGLCDVFTAGGVTDSFTLPNGSLITDWTQNNKDDFITSWEF